MLKAITQLGVAINIIIIIMYYIIMSEKSLVLLQKYGDRLSIPNLSY